MARTDPASEAAPPTGLGDDRWYDAARSKDRRFDGAVYLAVTSTGIYCRPSCPARTPLRRHCRFFPSAAAAQHAGFRACKRCRPDAAPGSPEWNRRADVVGRAMQLIADGEVDRHGVSGLADRLSYGERQLHRLLVSEVGAGPLAIAVAQRAQTARLLIETTSMPITDVAFAAGFSSVRQFNDTIAKVYDATPTQLRTSRSQPSSASIGADSGSVTVRLAVRQPFDAGALFTFLAARAVPGVESWDGTTYRRSLRLPGGLGVVALTAMATNGNQCDHIRAALRLETVSDLAVAVYRCRRLLDLDADPLAVLDFFANDDAIGALVRCQPGLRVPGHVDGGEVAVRAVLGQQVSVAGARTLAARLAEQYGQLLPESLRDPTHAVVRTFPTAEVLAGIEPECIAGPRSRSRALVGLCSAIARGDLDLSPGADRRQTQDQMASLPGIGPWTAGYISMRALSDPDVFLPSDLGVRHALERLGHDGRPRAAAAMAERWRPWRSYALMHLWSTL